MKTLDQLLMEIEARANAANSTGALIFELDASAADVPTLLAMLRKCIEQRNTYAPKGIVDIVHNAELLKLAGGE